MPNDDISTENKQPATISFLAHENAMMHKDADNERAFKECERMHKTVRILCITFFAVIVVFVTGYTVRTRYWLDTISKLTTPTVEVSNAENQPIP